MNRTDIIATSDFKRIFRQGISLPGFSPENTAIISSVASSSISSSSLSLASQKDFALRGDFFTSKRYGDWTPAKRQKYRQSFYQRLFPLLPSKDQPHTLPFKNYDGNVLQIYKEADAIVVECTTSLMDIHLLRIQNDGSSQYIVYFGINSEEDPSTRAFLRFTNDSNKISDVVCSEGLYFELDQNTTQPGDPQMIQSYRLRHRRPTWTSNEGNLGRQLCSVSLMELLYQKYDALAASLTIGPDMPYQKEAEYFKSCAALLQSLQDNTHPILHETNLAAICKRSDGAERTSITYGPFWNSAIAPENSRFKWSVIKDHSSKTVGLSFEQATRLESDYEENQLVKIYTTDRIDTLRVELIDSSEYTEHESRYESSAYLVRLQEDGSLAIVPEGAGLMSESYYVEYEGAVHVIDSHQKSWQQSSDDIVFDSQRILEALERISDLSQHSDTILLRSLKGGYQNIFGQAISQERMLALTYRNPQHLYGVPAPAQILHLKRLEYCSGGTGSPLNPLDFC